MQCDFKTLVKFAQHLRAHLNEPMFEVNEDSVNLKAIRVHAFHEEYVFSVQRTIERRDEARLMVVATTAQVDFVMRVEMVERDGKYVDTFQIYQEGDAVVIGEEDVKTFEAEMTESRLMAEQLPDILGEQTDAPSPSPIILTP